MADERADRFPYEGTEAELKEVEREIAELAHRRADLEREHFVLQEHRSYIRQLIRRRRYS